LAGKEEKTSVYAYKLGQRKRKRPLGEKGRRISAGQPCFQRKKKRSVRCVQHEGEGKQEEKKGEEKKGLPGRLFLGEEKRGEKREKCCRLSNSAEPKEKNASKEGKKHRRG